jgi:hypothetical protein
MSNAHRDELAIEKPGVRSPKIGREVIRANTSRERAKSRRNSLGVKL